MQSSHVVRYSGKTCRVVPLAAPPRLGPGTSAATAAKPSACDPVFGRGMIPRLHLAAPHDNWHRGCLRSCMAHRGPTEPPVATLGVPAARGIYAVVLKPLRRRPAGSASGARAGSRAKRCNVERTAMRLDRRCCAFSPVVKNGGRTARGSASARARPSQRAGLAGAPRSPRAATAPAPLGMGALGVPVLAVLLGGGAIARVRGRRSGPGWSTGCRSGWYFVAPSGVCSGPSPLACAAAAVQRIASRPASYLICRIMRRRTTEDIAAMNTSVGDFLGQWRRRTIGRPKLRWEDPWRSLVGDRWWAATASWKPRAIAGALLCADTEGTRRVDQPG